MIRRNARRLAWLAMLLLTFGAAYSYAGVIMVGSFSIANPAGSANYRLVARIYVAIIGVCALGVIGVSIYLVQSYRHGRASRPAV
jgi:heme/copper-type cytochrome/quinol oxidase subunit 2